MIARNMKWIMPVLVLLAAESAAGQSDPAAYQRARAALPGANATAFESIVASARARGLPIDPLVNKVLEGTAKRIPADRIIAVVRQRADQLGRAQSLTNSRVSSEIVVVADALQRGMPDTKVRELKAKSRRNEPFGLALHTYLDLVQSGVPAEVALDVLSGWRARGARANDLRDLPAAVERLVRQGAAPGRAGTAVAAALRSGNSASSARIGGTMNASAKGPKVNKPPVKPKGTPQTRRSATVQPRKGNL